MAACLGLGGLSLLLPSAPTYDPWAWLVWGREVADGTLSTASGPAWKPLPVAVTALLSALGDAAPDAWLAVSRAGTLLAAAGAFVLARRLVAPGVGAAWAGAGAAAAVLLCQDLLWHAAMGNSEGLLLACGLFAAERALAGRLRGALLLGFAAALLRPEAWPFFGALALWAGAREPRLRPLAAGLVLAVPLAWIVPEWIGSGDPWRSSERARVPNPGAPALADVPALEALRRGLAIPPAPALAAAALAPLVARRLAWPLGAGLAWAALVAAMAQLGGYSGEERYMLPGAALVALAGGAAGGLLAARLLGATAGRRGRGKRPVGKVSAPTSVSGTAGSAPVPLVAGLLAVAVAVPLLAVRARDVIADVRGTAAEARLIDGLDDALAAAGGRDAVLRCGRPYAGPLRGPALAWGLRVPKSRIGFAPRAPGVAFVSRLPSRDRPEPAVPAGWRKVAAAGGWSVVRACR